MVPAKTRKLTDPQEVVALSKSDQTFWAQRDLRMKDTQDLVEQDGEVNTEDPDAISVLSNDGAIVVRKLSAMAGSQEPTINIVAAQSVKEQAERTEDLLKAARFEMALRHAQGARAPLAYDEAQSIFLRGWITGRILLNDTPDEHDSFLWDYTLFDPIQVYPTYSRKDLYRVTTITDTTAGELLADWGKDAEKLLGDGAESEKLKLYGYYDREQMAVATDKGWLKKPAKHGYPFGVPWVVGLGPGAFYRATASDTANYTKYVGQGILDIVKGQIRNEEKVLTMLHTLVAKEAEPPVVLYTNAEGETVELDLRSGGRNILAASDKLDILRVGPKLEDLKILADSYRSRVERGTIPSILFGDNATNLTGFLANVLQGSARDLLYPYLRGLETYYTILYRKMLELFVAFGTDMDVVTTDRSGQQLGGVKVSKLEVQALNNPRLVVAFKDITPRDEAAKVQMAIGLKRDNLISAETAREKYLDLDNPIAENTKVLGELAYMDQSIVKVASAMALQKQAQAMGFSVTDLMAIVQQIQASTSGQAPPGGPGAPPPQGGGVPPDNTMLPPNALPPQMGAVSGLPPGMEAMGPQASGPPDPQSLQLPLQ
ncbi:MAG: hypothetical protein HYX52_05740 [Chloroflexi bacterium]|nr:hypothetical protein [Chloroflexota bacterium]